MMFRASGVDPGFLMSMHEQKQVNELEWLVEAGNWEAVMAAANRFETASDVGSLTEDRAGRQMSMLESVSVGSSVEHSDYLSGMASMSSQDSLSRRRGAEACN